MRLGDGTEVRLYPGSAIEYDQAHQNRQIRLEGKAFFSVAPDPEHPFHVETPSTEIWVLGTRFLLEEDQTRQQTTVKVTEGTVKFVDINSVQSIIVPAYQ